MALGPGSLSPKHLQDPPGPRLAPSTLLPADRGAPLMGAAGLLWVGVLNCGTGSRGQLKQEEGLPEQWRTGRALPSRTGLCR